MGKKLGLFILLCTLISACYNASALCEENPAALYEKLLLDAEALIENFKPVKAYEPYWSENYPENRASYIISLLKQIPSDEALAARVDALASKGFDYTREEREPRSRAELQRDLALAVNRWDHDRALQLADKIQGPQTRERAFFILGGKPYKSLPEKPERQVAYYRQEARSVADVIEKAKLYIRGMEILQSLPALKEFLTQDFLTEDFSFIPDLGARDRKLAVNFITLLKSIEISSDVSGSSHWEMIADGKSIAYLDRLATFDFTEAERMARSLELKTAPHCFRAVALLHCAEFIYRSDRKKSAELAAMAKQVEAKATEDEKSPFVYFGPYEFENWKAESIIAGTFTPGSKTRPGEKDSEDEESLEHYLGAFAGDLKNEKFPGMRDLLLYNIKKEDRNRFIDFIDRNIKTKVINIKKIDSKIIWLADVGALLKEKDPECAKRYIDEAYSLLRREKASYEEYQWADILCSFIDFDRSRGEEFLTGDYLDLCGPNVNSTMILEHLLEIDAPFVYGITKKPMIYPPKPAALIWLKYEGRKYDLYAGGSLFDKIARRMIKEKGPEFALTFVDGWNYFSPTVWHPFFDEMRKSEQAKLEEWSRSNSDSGLKMESALYVLRSDSEKGLAILKSIGENQKKPYIAGEVARYANLQAALELIESISAPEWRLAAILRAAGGVQKK